MTNGMSLIEKFRSLSGAKMEVSQEVKKDAELTPEERVEQANKALWDEQVKRHEQEKGEVNKFGQGEKPGKVLKIAGN